MLGDTIYTNSLDEAFIRSLERIFYAYYSGAPGHSIKDGMSSRDKVQDGINLETIVFISDQKGNSLAHSSIKTTESRHTSSYIIGPFKKSTKTTFGSKLLT